MNPLFSYFRELCLCQQMPKNCPHAPVLLGIVAMLLTMLITLQWWITDFGVSSDLLILGFTAISLVCSYVIYTLALLLFRQLIRRAVQTLTCLFATHLIIHCYAMPLILLAPYLMKVDLSSPVVLFLAVIYLFLTLALSIWQVIVTAHIYKYALDATPVQSVMAAFGLIAVNILTLSFWR